MRGLPSPLAPCPARTSMAAPPPRSQRRDAALLPAPGLQERPKSGDPALPPPAAGPRTCLCGPQGLSVPFPQPPFSGGPQGLVSWAASPGHLLPRAQCRARCALAGERRPSLLAAGGLGVSFPPSESSLYFPHLCLRLKHLFFSPPFVIFIFTEVEKGHLAKPLFPAVYKEFEELHKMVTKLCQDYLRSSGPCSQAPLEVNNNKVAESLGITEEFLRKREGYADCVPGKCTSPEEAPAELEGARPQKRADEIAEDGLASVKRTRRDAVPQDPTECPAEDGGLQRPALRAPAAGAGFAPGVNGGASPGPEESPAMPAPKQEGSAAQAGHRLAALTGWAAQGGPVDPTALRQGALGRGSPVP